MSHQSEQRCVDTIRTLSMDAVQKANSGHPGMPMGMADAAFVLWTEFLNHNPHNPGWFNRDRFILSAGHGSMLLYSLLHLTGYDLALDELKNFRQWGSKTPGHPETGHTPGVETTTGPLGQGFGNGVGMAIAAKHLAARVNTPSIELINPFIYAIVSDGDVMEGVAQEAASLAGHLGLGNLIYLYDDNSITIDGHTDLAFTEDVMNRFTAYGWHTQTIDGHNRDAIRNAIRVAQAENNRPSIIACKTHIGFGSPNKQDSEKSHGSPLGEEEVRLTKTAYGWDPDAHFFIPDDVLTIFRNAVASGKKKEQDWNLLKSRLADTAPEKVQYLEHCLNKTLPPNWKDTVPFYEPDPKGMATRKASGNFLDALAPAIPGIMGGTADLGGSVNTAFKGHSVFSKHHPAGNYLHYGVREHAMGAIMNGMALFGGIRPYAGTFLVFSDYCRPSIRLSALMKQPVIYVFTHDSIGLGEDGPTHQPVEQLAALRAIPNNLVLRPADANETSKAWEIALQRSDGPTCIILTRQNVPVLADVKSNLHHVEKGAYTIFDAGLNQNGILIIATGSEVQIAMDAAKKLQHEKIGVRVVSMPSAELFRNQPESYRKEVLPDTVANRISVEAGVTFGWHEWTGRSGITIGLDRFGESAPFEVLYEKLGIHTGNVMEAAHRLLS